MSFSQDFFEKVLLLVLTASITGFLIPYLLKKVEDRKTQRLREDEDRKTRELRAVEERRAQLLREEEERKAKRLREEDERRTRRQQETDDRRLREQKQYEASLARQSKIIDAQVRLLENLSDLIWEYQLLAIEVSYVNLIDQSELYDTAVKEYNKKTGPTFAKIRAEISKALHLTSRDTYEKLKHLYYKVLIPLDMKLCALMREQKDSEKRIHGWGEFNRYAVHDLAEKIDKTLDNLAKELQLKSIAMS